MSAFRDAAGVRADEPTAVERVFGRYSAALGDVHEFEATGDLARVTRVGSTSSALTSAMTFGAIAGLAGSCVAGVVWALAGSVAGWVAWTAAAIGAIAAAVWAAWGERRVDVIFDRRARAITRRGDRSFEIVLGAGDRIALRRSYDPNASIGNAWIYVDRGAGDGEVPQHPLVAATGSAEQLAAVKAFTLALAGWMDAPFVERSAATTLAALRRRDAALGLPVRDAPAASAPVASGTHKARAARDPVRELVERRVGELPQGDPVSDVVEIIGSVGGLLGKLLD